MIHRLFILLSFLFLPMVTLWSQDLLVEKNERDRYAFAQGYVGLTTQYLPGGDFTFQNGEVSQISDAIHPRFVIGGTHFWGFVDFYVSLGLGSTIPISSQSIWTDENMNTGNMTGMKLYPFAMRKNRIDPFVGINWSFFDFEASSDDFEGANILKHRVAYELGLSYTSSGGNIFEVQAMYTPRAEMDYFTSRTARGRLESQGITASVSYKRMFESTAANEGHPISPENPPGKYGNAFHIGIGPSSSQSLVASKYHQTITPYMNPLLDWMVFPEISAGYYFYKPDFDVRLTYRPMRSKASAHGILQTTNRQSLALEVYKNLFDYQGFVPFIGISLAAEWYRFEQSGSSIETIDLRQENYVPGLVFGWDIRPTKYNDWLLRTNLRFYPTAKMDVQGLEISMNQLEFNFIQFVAFPQRWFE